MKKIILLFTVCISSAVSAQVITFTDADFKNALVNTQCTDLDGDGITDDDVDTNNDGEIQISEALAVTELGISSQPIGDLTGIEHFSNLTVLYCAYNELTTLDVSSLTSLNRLSCEYNQLTSLNVSGLSNLYMLNCNNNQLTSLDLSGGLISLNNVNCRENQLSNLNLAGLTNLNLLDCNYNQLVTLDASGLISLTRLECYYNQLTTLNVSGLTNLNLLACRNNQLTTLDVSGLEYLSYLFCSDNQLTSITVNLNHFSQLDCTNNLLTTLDLSGQTSLANLYCANNQLTTLDVSESDFLYALDCSNNQLSSLLIKNGSDESIIISNNPNLEFICCDATQIQDVQAVVNSSGLTNCAVSSLCSFTPGGNFNTIQGSAIFDSNNNGCDSLDTYVYQFTINITDGVNAGTLIADNNGYFAIPVQAGNYTFTPILPNSNYFTITPSVIQITLPDTSSNTLTPFCITPNGIHHDLEVTILPITPARPGFAASHSLVYKNNGNQVENGSVSFSFDDNVLDFSNASTAPNTTSTGVLTWNFSNLLPFQSESISLTFNCNTPTETPPLNAGDTLYFTSTITGGQADETPLDNTFDLAQVVVGSYDPNDKTCLEGDLITPEMVGDYVHYMIRFENTGTYAAENVAVSDIIDVSRFDISSLQITASSHSMKTRISNGNEVEFIFEHINLAFDDANNDGYVAFKIKTLATLQLNDTLKNQANIYFDYNAPITTNEAQTVVQYPNSSVSLGFNSTDNTLNLFPNPAENILYIPADVQITQADIFDMKGALVRSVSVRNNQIEVQGLASGTYFTRLYSDAKLYSAKFMMK